MALREIFGILVLFVSLLNVSNAATDAELTEKYRFNKVLDGDNNTHYVYKLFWSFNKQEETISLAVRVVTSGWVGFGLSPDGQMLNSDVVIGWVDSSGTAHFHDRHTGTGPFRRRPMIDAHQDWQLISGQEVTEYGYTYTVLEFKRNFTTCDENDRDINPETHRVIWSYKTTDPDDENSVSYHTDRGSASVNLLGGSENVRSTPPDSKSFFVRNENLTVPESKTTYWCSKHEIWTVTGEQLDLWKKDIYIYKVKPHISPENKRHIHHMMVFLCPWYATIKEGLCSESSNSFFGCFAGEILGAWAVGGEEFVFPEDVAFPVHIGDDQRKPYQLLLEMHYDDVTQPNGIIDSSGMEFFYTLQKPTYLAGTVTVSIGAIPALIVPPQADDFTITTTCNSDCTQNQLPESGVNVFASFLHSHLLGTEMTVKHFRNVTDTACNAVEELQPIDSNPSYDFDFQQLNHLQRLVQVKKGDTIQLECHYKSNGVGRTNRTNITLGGEGTRDEMCQTMLLYYPRSNLTTCGTYPDANSAYRPFFNKYYFGHQAHTNSAVSGIRAFDREGIKVAFRTIDWKKNDKEAVKDFQKFVINAANEQSVCSNSDSNNPQTVTLKPRFVADCTYVAPDKCSDQQPQTCCERLENRK